MLVSGRVFGKWVSTFFSLKPGVAIPMDGCILYVPSHGLDARNHDINLSLVHDMKNQALGSTKKHKATRNRHCQQLLLMLLVLQFLLLFWSDLRTSFATFTSLSPGQMLHFTSTGDVAFGGSRRYTQFWAICNIILRHISSSSIF